ncbi:hypothetical protein [Flavobacterium sp. 25HG05S-40]|uniref:hypothetical protein n=1 Tax=Flavobacterium sp. 25HG05S-40 TaxID=3458682 RepID=UPI00404418C4
MQPKQPIEDLLKELQKLYDNPADPIHKDYYSKLALLELCGWLEHTQDEIIKSYSDFKLTETRNKDEIRDFVIGKTYGCDYMDHFRPMIIKLIGYKQTEFLENKLKSAGQFQILRDQLSSLWALRRRAAHTSMVGVTITYQAPSSMRTYLNSLYPILTAVETELNTL